VSFCTIRLQSLELNSIGILFCATEVSSIYKRAACNTYTKLNTVDVLIVSRQALHADCSSKAAVMQHSCSNVVVVVI